MPARRPAPTAALRGGAVGATAASLAVAAHGLGGGGLPDTAALTLLLAVAVSAGAVVAGVPVLTRSRWALLGALAAGQGATHVALTVASDLHVHRNVPAAGMLAAHAAATVVCAALILAAERLYGPLTRVLRAVLATPTVGVEPHRVLLPAPTHPRAPRIAVLATGLSRRGPPKWA
ncbi:hypothetical protein [Rhodococcus sp. SGAir0479]|uniref:hypothetical protein n=1 Tax=Rhodococcus sp. SGAir0479 TaxID=2567884 RepID=UPI0010CD2455|nr:hypothetical protein [Rhodococcus sp. SGAir0479]QCQ93128.1 hypothetical protein E7742_19160 [Rhodococcus sp. SGAir0479]